jgi:hypothetical protein
MFMDLLESLGSSGFLLYCYTLARSRWKASLDNGGDGIASRVDILQRFVWSVLFLRPVLLLKGTLTVATHVLHSSRRETCFVT